MPETRIDELRRRLEREPGSRLFAQLAEEHRKAGDHAEAIRVARAGLALHPAYTSARLTLGRALLDAGEAAGARAELSEVLREAPDNILAGRFLGQALEMAGDTAGALQQYTATLKMAPGDRQLEAQIAALRARTAVARPGAPEVTAPMRAVAPPLPPGTVLSRPPVPPPPPTDRMMPPLGAGRAAPPRPPAVTEVRPAPALAPPLADSAPTLGQAPASMERPLAAAPTAEEAGDEAPTLSGASVPDLSAFVTTLPAQTPPVPGGGEDGSRVAPSEPGGLPEQIQEALAAVSLPAAVEEERPKDAVAETLSPPDPSEGAADAMAEAEPQPGPGLAAGPAREEAPLSSSTLAELYLRQGLTDRAREVYRQVLADDPGNERARAGLLELEVGSTGGAVDERTARRAALQRTIGALEAMLAAVRRA